MAIPGQVLTNPTKIYATIDDFCKFSGLDSANKYFVDPSSQEGQQAAQQAQQTQQQQQQEAQQAQLEQMRMQAELAKSATTTAEAQMQNVAIKGQVELGKHQREMEKQSFQIQLEQLKAELDKAKAVQIAEKDLEDIKFKYDQLYAQTALKLTELEASSNTSQDVNYEQNRNNMYDG